jgi:hypothetical protein
LGLLEGSRDDGGGQVEQFSQVFNTLVSQEPVIVSPSELFLNQTLADETSHQLHDLKNGGFGDLGMFLCLPCPCLLSNKDTLFEEVRENGKTVFLGDNHLLTESILLHAGSG